MPMGIQELLPVLLALLVAALLPLFRSSSSSSPTSSTRRRQLEADDEQLQDNHSTPLAPFPHLPPDLHAHILLHLSLPSSSSSPPPYRDLLRTSLVCRSWAQISQRLLWREIWLSGGDEQMEAFLAVEQKEEWEVEALTVLQKPEDVHEGRISWTVDPLREVIERCENVKRFTCFIEFLDDAPIEALNASFTNLRSVELVRPLLDVTLPFPSLTSLTILDTNDLPAQRPLALDLAFASQNGNLPNLCTLRLAHISWITLLLPLAPSLRTLHLPTIGRYRRSSTQQSFLLDSFLPACTSLTRLVLDALQSDDLLAALPPSVTRIEVRDVAAGDVTTGHFSTYLELCRKEGRKAVEVVQLRVESRREPGKLDEAARAKLGPLCDELGVTLLV